MSEIERNAREALDAVYADIADNFKFDDLCEDVGSWLDDDLPDEVRTEAETIHDHEGAQVLLLSIRRDEHGRRYLFGLNEQWLVNTAVEHFEGLSGRGTGLSGSAEIVAMSLREYRDTFIEG